MPSQKPNVPSTAMEGNASTHSNSGASALCSAFRAMCKKRSAKVHPLGTASPQLASGGRRCWAPHWGVTRRQLQELLLQLRSNDRWIPSYNVYDLVDKFIKPMTAGTGTGYALMINKDEPKEVNLMVSHAWGENAEEFLETCIRYATDSDAMFICALALYQVGDPSGPTIEEQLGSEPSDSPFFRVLQHIHDRGSVLGPLQPLLRLLCASPPLLLCVACIAFYLTPLWHGCVPLADACAVRARLEDSDGASIVSWEWQWIDLPEDTSGSTRVGLLLLAAAFVCQCLKRLAYNGHMVVVPNRECDIYTRLWCVYEIFVARERTGVPVALGHTFASAGSCSSREARCGNQQDMDRIAKDIVDAGGDKEYDLIDRAVYMTTRAMYANAAFWVLWFAALVVTFCTAEWHLRSPQIEAGSVVGNLLACSICGCAVTYWACFMCTKMQGRLSPKAIAQFVLPVFLGACLLGGVNVVGGAAFPDEQKTLKNFNYAWFASFCGNGATFLIFGCLIGGGALVGAVLVPLVPECVVSFAMRRPAAFLPMLVTPLVLLHAMAFTTLITQSRDLYAACIFHTAGVVGYFLIPFGLAWKILVHEWGVRIVLYE